MNCTAKTASLLFLLSIIFVLPVAVHAQEFSPIWHVKRDLAQHPEQVRQEKPAWWQFWKDDQPSPSAVNAVPQLPPTQPRKPSLLGSHSTTSQPPAPSRYASTGYAAIQTPSATAAHSAVPSAAPSVNQHSQPSVYRNAIPNAPPVSNPRPAPNVAAHFNPNRNANIYEPSTPTPSQPAPNRPAPWAQTQLDTPAVASQPVSPATVSAPEPTEKSGWLKKLNPFRKKDEAAAQAVATGPVASGSTAAASHNLLSFLPFRGERQSATTPAARVPQPPLWSGPQAPPAYLPPSSMATRPQAGNMRPR